MSDNFTTKYIEIQGVEQTFKTKRGPFCALQNVNLTVAKGEFVALIGHSGCGKSILLNLIARLPMPKNRPRYGATSTSNSRRLRFLQPLPGPG